MERANHSLNILENANIIPQGHARRIKEHILAFIHLYWVTEVIEFSLETIKIIYVCLSSEETCAEKESPVWLYMTYATTKGQSSQCMKHILLTQ